MDKAIEMLYDEHDYIMTAIDNVKGMKPMIAADPDNYKKELSRYIDFFKNYADRFHHYKEEEILFPEMSKKNELLEDGVIKEMLDNHADFRIMIGNITSFNEAGELAKAHAEFEKYAEALLDHIAVENDEVFQMAESLFDESELDKIYFRFKDCDMDLGEEYKKEMEGIL